MKATVKYDLRPLVRVNVVDPDGSALRTFGQVVFIYGLPAALGVAVGIWVHFGLTIQNGVSVALPSASLLVGAMFGAFIFLTNMRIKLAESPTYAFRADLLRLVGSGAAACLYLGIVSVVFAAVLALVGSLPWLRSDDVAAFTVATLVAISTHLGIMLFMIVRRLFIVYLALFASDFNPTVGESAAGARAEAGAATPRERTIVPTRRSRRLLR